jgi:predicted enzyme related to lactoylglutathione lyase
MEVSTGPRSPRSPPATSPSIDERAQCPTPRRTVEPMTEFRRISPIFPVRDLESAIEHYSELGFHVRRYEGPEPYAFVERSGLEVHLTQVAGLKPKRNMSAAYLYVEDADELYSEWKRAAAGGRLIKPKDTSYGLREGATLDLDANLIRFGSEIDQ